MKHLFPIIGVFFALLPTTLFAAQISTDAPNAVGVGDEFAIPVLLDTQNESINALDGDLAYPHDTLQLREIRDGNSIITFWIARPSDTGSAIHFAGIIPAGYVGNTGELVTLVFETKHSGVVHLSLIGAHALKNDGKGTAARLSLKFPSFVIKAKGTGMIVPPLRHDTQNPENFVPSISSDPSIFGGKYFLTFATQDKASGIDHYEVAESGQFRWFGLQPLAWRSATSPYELADQALQSYVYIKAVDRAGNERIEVLSPQHPTIAACLAILVAILMGTLLLILWRRFYVVSRTRVP
jgi:hypothetical protein